ncbi:glycosyltransferase [Streptomyces sp. UNOB3_S3]|uniref:glycosyltransferase n=1 Tax=Streptomyces sp. UNOB3_S3 TaxID=2871682 RepID=UPI001E5006FC|nr:glycosyltransferase [Streptomyces sp. UNOB3_S3]MCC3776684.1 glycosyltransferase [Streptomyces sp. UNOB3_S3]
MRVTLLAIGSRGDVQPFIALGVGLRERGHEVTLAAPASLQKLVERAGLEYKVTPGDPDGFFSMPEVRDSLRRSPLMRDLLKNLPKAPEGYDQVVVDAVHEAAQGADFIVNAPLTLAAAYGHPPAPWASVCWWPNSSTWSFPAVESHQRRMGPLTPLYNRYSHWQAARDEWAWRRPEIDGYRTRMDLPPFGRTSPFPRLGHERPYLYPFSPSVLPKPADWPRRAHVTGFWYWDQEWQAPADFQAFLDDGPAPVALTFGSTWSLHDQRQALEYAIDAARGAGRRLVMVDGPDDDLPDDVFRLHDVDYAGVFPKMAAVIHHGGVGTTAQVLRAGVPQVICPVFADHPFWAARLAELGVGARPVPFTRFARTGRQELAASVRQAVNDPRMADRAQRLGRLVAQERGVDNACDVLEDWARASGVTVG